MELYAFGLYTDVAAGNRVGTNVDDATTIAITDVIVPLQG
jgi:hypothetical protein